MQRTLTYSMRAETRMQYMTLLNLSWQSVNLLVGIQSGIRRDIRALPPLTSPHHIYRGKAMWVHTARKRLSTTQRECSSLDTDLTGTKFLLFKLPSLKYFVVAAWTDQQKQDEFSTVFILCTSSPMPLKELHVLILKLQINFRE